MGFQALKRIALCGLLLAGAARAALAEDAAATTDSDFDVVPVDLSGQMFTKVLPFDVPFIITGSLPEGVSTFEVRCWVLRTDSKKDPVLLENDKDDKGRVRPRPKDGDCWGANGPPLVWRNRIDPKATNPQFRLLVPRLEAEQYYEFKFSFQKTVSAEEAQAFADKVQTTLETELWGTPDAGRELPWHGDIPPNELADIRGRLVQALTLVTGADRVTEPGILDPDTPFAQIEEEFNVTLLPVNTVQGQIAQSLKNYNGEVKNLPALLARVRDDATLQKLQAALSSLAGTAVKDDLRTIAAATGLGDPPSPGDADLQSAAALAAFAKAGGSYYSDALDKVSALRDLLAGLIGPDGSPQPFLDPLLKNGTLTRDDLDTLTAMSAPTGSVGSVQRALNRASQILASGIPDLLNRRAAAVADVAGEYRTRAETMILFAGSTTGSFATQHKNYVSADAGVACAPELSDCTTYMGTNIYFRPVNKAAPLNQFTFRQSLARRVSVTFGLTVNGIGDNGKTREDLFSTQSLVAGIGARVTNSVRVTTGVIAFKKLDPNPLVDDTSLATTYFFSLSFDVDVLSMIGGIGGLFTTK
jgi:hypothetical protein